VLEHTARFKILLQMQQVKGLEYQGPGGFTVYSSGHNYYALVLSFLSAAPDTIGSIGVVGLLHPVMLRLAVLRSAWMQTWFKVI
jgi:hypothetical protein